MVASYKQQAGADLWQAELGAKDSHQRYFLKSGDFFEKEDRLWNEVQPSKVKHKT